MAPRRGVEKLLPPYNRQVFLYRKVKPIIPQSQADLNINDMTDGWSKLSLYISS
jgi:hypothetical protein